jgi:hypothetical protein
VPLLRRSVCEPYTLWLLEDSFPAGRPPLEDVGVQLVDDVAPYELKTLRLLGSLRARSTRGDAGGPGLRTAAGCPARRGGAVRQIGLTSGALQGGP